MQCSFDIEFPGQFPLEVSQQEVKRKACEAVVTAWRKWEKNITCYVTTWRDHQPETAMAALTEISWAVLLNEVELERRQHGVSHFVIANLSLWVCIKRCPLRTSRSNWRNTGRWQRWQTYDGTMGAHPESQMMLFLLSGTSHTNDQGKGLSYLYCRCPTCIPSVYRWVLKSQWATSILFWWLPNSSSSLLLLSWEFSLLGSMGAGGGMAEEFAQLTGWMACHETTLTEGQELVDVYSIF